MKYLIITVTALALCACGVNKEVEQHCKDQQTVSYEYCYLTATE